MISKLSNKIVNFFFCDFEDEDEKEIYKYGVQIILSTAVNIVIVMIIGLLLNMLLESIIYLMTLAIIRSFTGGYHANTYFKCNLILSVNLIAVLIISNLLLSYQNTLLIWGSVINVIFLIVVIIKAPQDSENKQLDISEKRKFKLYSVSATLVFIAIWFVFIKFNIILSIVISMSLASIAISLIYKQRKV